MSLGWASDLVVRVPGVVVEEEGRFSCWLASASLVVSLGLWPLQSGVPGVKWRMALAEMMMGRWHSQQRARDCAMDGSPMINSVMVRMTLESTLLRRATEHNLTILDRKRK